MRACFGLLQFSVLALSAAHALAQHDPGDTNAQWLAEHYTKYEYRIPI